MAIGPFFNQLPGVYGPIGYPVRKTENGYYTKGYSSDEFTGSVEDIANKILYKLVYAPESGQRKHYVGPFAISFLPTVRCGFVMNANPDPPELDCWELSEEISKVLRRHINVVVEDDFSMRPTVTIDGQPHPIVKADTPYIFDIWEDHWGGNIAIKLDYHGLTFQVIGDKYKAAIAYLKDATEQHRSFKDIPTFKHAKPYTTKGPINFYFVNDKISKIEPSLQKKIHNLSFTPENRPEVFEMIKIMNSVLKMKAFW